jgi:hypothetical protein
MEDEQTVISKTEISRIQNIELQVEKTQQLLEN